MDFFFFFLATEAFGLADAFALEDIDMVGFGAGHEPVAAFAALRPVVSAISETAAPAMIRRFIERDLDTPLFSCQLLGICVGEDK